MLYLRRGAAVCGNQLILETHGDALDYPCPVAVFYPFDTLNNDPSNFWGPNPACVDAMLREVGFSSVKTFEGIYGSAWCSMRGRSDGSDCGRADQSLASSANDPDLTNAAFDFQMYVDFRLVVKIVLPVIVFLIEACYGDAADAAVGFGPDADILR